MIRRMSIDLVIEVDDDLSRHQKDDESEAVRDLVAEHIRDSMNDGHYQYSRARLVEVE